MSIDARILAALRQPDPGAVSGADLAHQLGVSRAAIWARIEELRKLGYEIEASPHRGYRLTRSPDVLHADDLLSQLPRIQVIGRDIRVFQETTSTNDVIERLARDNVREGVVVFAESQTRGRGRLGRRWLSPPGKGLWFSVLLRPKLAPQQVTQITVAAATALIRAIRRHTDLQPEVKWPNDILLRGRKTAGILTELSAEVDTVKYVILGVGIDVNLAQADYPSALRETATSLRIESGHPVSRAELATSVMAELDRDYARLIDGAFEEVAAEWESYCTTLGHNVVIHVGDRTIQGRAEVLDADGALILRTLHGRTERIVGGDVTLQK